MHTHNMNFDVLARERKECNERGHVHTWKGNSHLTLSTFFSCVHLYCDSGIRIFGMYLANVDQHSWSLYILCSMLDLDL